MSRFYSYMLFVYVGNGVYSALRVVHFDSLRSARLFARRYVVEHNISEDMFHVLRYHVFRGYEDKQYSI